MTGGASRQETIERLAGAAQGSVVIIHDVARPYAGAKLFQTVLEGAQQHRACVTAVEVKVRDSLCRSSDGFAGDIVDRCGLVQIQTPQAFDRALLIRLLAKARLDGCIETSLVAVFRRAGFPVNLADGDPANIKITYPEDLMVRPTAAIAGSANVSSA